VANQFKKETEMASTELVEQEKFAEYFRTELSKHAQTIAAYNKMPWYKRVFVTKLEVRCRADEGFNCCCGKHQS